MADIRKVLTEHLRELHLPTMRRQFEEEARRVYPLGASAAHFIGFVDKGGRGLAGS